jgi:AraC-like DNA-binding protein
MKYQLLPPPPSLAAYLRYFWVLENEHPVAQTYTHRSMADGCAEMVFHYKGVFDELLSGEARTTSFTAGVHGPSQQFQRYVIEENFGIFGVYFYPYALQRLLGIPANALSNQVADLHTLLGATGRMLEEMIMLAKNNRARIHILTDFFERQLAKSKASDHRMMACVREIIQANGAVNVQEMAGQYCLSLRQFERNFKASAGFTPKLYARIIRFQSAIAQYGNKSLSLTALAHDCGYYDQSHFIHDFNTFSGYHPRQFFSGLAEGVEWREA